MRAVNLLPRELPKRARKRLTTVVRVSLVAPFVVGALLTVGYLLASSKVDDRKGTLEALQVDLAALPPVTTTAQPDSALVIERDQRVAALSVALQGRFAWDRILREISVVLPSDVWLTTLTATSPQAQPAAAPPSTTTESTTTTGTQTTTTTPAPTPATTAPLSLGGYTYSQEGVARFLSRLAVLPDLQNVKLIQSAESTVAEQPVVSFSIQADVRSEVTG